MFSINSRLIATLILTLMLAVATWRRLAVIVTSFTAAHSLTLIAATLGLLRLPNRNSILRTYFRYGSDGVGIEHHHKGVAIAVLGTDDGRNSASA